MTSLTDIDPRDARIAELEQMLAQRDERIAKLEAAIEKFNRYLGLDSNNSSHAPSSDDDTSRSKRKRRQKRGKQGAQPGHKGHKRELIELELVDYVHPLYPEQCSCGLEFDLEQDVVSVERVQQFELVPKLVECTEHRLHTCHCKGCGEFTRPTLAAHHRLGWGPRLAALLATLSVTLHATRRKLEWFVQHVLGAPSSLGTIQHELLRASRALAPAHAQARAHVMKAKHLGADETGWRLGRLPHLDLGGAVSERGLLCDSRRTSKRKEAAELLQESQALSITTDQLSAYEKVVGARSQYCRAHLLRKWMGMAAREGPVGAHGKRLCELERGLHKAHRAWREQNLSEEDFLKQARDYRVQIEEECTAAGPLKGCPAVARTVMHKKHREKGWLFLKYPEIELTNNQSERDLRPSVIPAQAVMGLAERRRSALDGEVVDGGNDVPKTGEKPARFHHSGCASRTPRPRPAFPFCLILS